MPIPTNRRLGLRHRRRAGLAWWSFNRLRDYRTSQQLDLERRRQDLRDQRWRRWQSMLLTIVPLAGLIAGRIDVTAIIDAVRHFA